MEANAEKESGGRRLTMVVLAAIGVAIVMVAVSLAIYYGSGDYLADSSRVGAERPLPRGDDWEFAAVGTLDESQFLLFLDHFDVNFKAVTRASF